MLKKIWSVFLRDLSVNVRDFISLYILVIPVLFAIGINLLAPSVNDTTVTLAMLDGDNPTQVASFEQYAEVELFANLDALVARVEKRDNVIAVVPDGDSYYLMTQGNEPESVLGFAKALKSFVELDVNVAESTAEIKTFGHTEPPLKKMLVNLTILLTSVLGGMLISINIVEEKVDNTISAMNVTTLPRTAFILGKSLMGIFLAIYGTIALVWITGYGDVNFGQLMLTLCSVTFLSLLIGFIQGVNNDDVMDAAASVKIVFLPIGAAVAAVELLSDKWQILFYWIPFYWTYKGNDAILSYSASWTQIISYTLIVLIISMIAYYLIAPKIKEGLA